MRFLTKNNISLINIRELDALSNLFSLGDLTSPKKTSHLVWDLQVALPQLQECRLGEGVHRARTPALKGISPLPFRIFLALTD